MEILWITAVESSFFHIIILSIPSGCYDRLQAAGERLTLLVILNVSVANVTLQLLSLPCISVNENIQRRTTVF